MIANPWDRVELATGGFSTAAEWRQEFGVQRDFKALVWHDMEGHLAGAIATWNQGKADAHLSVLESGEIVLTCLIEDVAWHAGTNATIGRTAFWRRNNINPHSIGIELEGFTTRPYTAGQARAVRRIALWAEAKYGIPRVHTVDQIEGQHLHSELSNQRSDPGPGFGWDWATG